MRILLLFALLLTGCATLKAPLHGIVQVADDGVRLDVRGQAVPLAASKDLIGELSRLDQASIGVRGTIQGGKLRVRSYELVEGPDGLPAHYGKLVVDQAGPVLLDEVSGSRIGLRVLDIDALKQHHGARLWVTGTFVGDQVLMVANWGILAPPG